MPHIDLVEHFFGEGAVRLVDRLRQELGETAEIISDDLVRNWLIAESGSLTASILSEIVERKDCYSASFNGLIANGEGRPPRRPVQ